jgi:phospholipase D-like protein/putative oligomerization/nucleic acid binding protein
VLPVGDYTFWDALWTMFVFFLWILWFFLLFKIIIDVFRRHDVGGGKKVVWLVFILFLPFLGAFAYIIANGDDMAKRDMERAQAQQAQFNDYVQSVATTGSGPAAEIDKAKQLLDSGAITQAEFDSLKAKALAS